MRLAAAVWFLFCGVALGSSPARAATGPAYLVYAGPYSSSPPSAFGHLFLLIQEDPDQPLPLWRVVSFSADADGVGALKFLYRGIFGGFRGRYRELAFHEKSRDYAALEDRDLWLAQLKLDAIELSALDGQLDRERGRSHPYTFFARNCAHYLQALLARVTPRMPEPSGTVSPLEVLDLAAENGLVTTWYRRVSASQQLEHRLASVSPAVRTRLREESWGALVADTAWTSALSKHDRRLLHDYAAWKLLTRDRVVPPATDAGLQRLRWLSARRSRGPAERGPINGVGREVVRPGFAPYSRLTVSVDMVDWKMDRTNLHWRPAIRDELDPWVVDRPANTLELGSLGLSWAPEGNSLRLEELVLFSQRSHAPLTWVVRPTSWLLEAAIRRGGLFGSDALHHAIRGGLGRTYELWSGFLTTGLATGALVGHAGDGVTLVPGAEVSLLHLLAPRLRWGLRACYEVNPWNTSVHDARVSGWLSWDFSRRLGLQCRYRRDLEFGRWVAGLSWYP